MILFPAIDLRGGARGAADRGDYDRMTVYGENPAETAKTFREAGATHLHLVDLDGAKDGAQTNLSVIAAIWRETAFSSRWGRRARGTMRASKGTWTPAPPA
jgi:phosphoribosylformimino-5-aminoimidazole carboxamide ribotide isomerase